MSSKPVVIFDDIGVTDVKLKLEINEGYYFLHSEVTRWSHNIFKRYLDILSHALIQLNDLGVNDVYVCIDSDNKKLRRWEEMFGFEAIREHEGHLLMHRSTG